MILSYLFTLFKKVFEIYSQPVQDKATLGTLSTVTTIFVYPRDIPSSAHNNIATHLAFKFAIVDFVEMRSRHSSKGSMRVVLAE